MQQGPISPSAESIQDWLVHRLAALQAADPRTVDARERFSRHGLDSQGAAHLVHELSQALGRPLSPVLIWEHPTPEALARHLALGAAAAPAHAGGPAAVEPSAEGEPIAVVGMACRLPGAAGLLAFWRLLCEGIDAVKEAPRSRWDPEALFDLDPSAPGKMNTRAGGFLDHIDQFEPQFFGISPREAVHMDPQQRLMLELSWEALEDAGLVAEELKGSRAGVFFGVAWTDYAMLVHRGGSGAIAQHTVTGFHRSIVANRVSYALGLQGPSLSIDTACSSSLVAVHLACESLRRGESTIALAGGVNLNLIPESTIGVSKFGALSPDGRCFTFDARANGYVRGEGGGVVVLKPLSRAIADGDPVYCVIRGSAVNNDGSSNGLTAPNPAAQEAVLRAAYARAGVDPADVDYVEAHGTGTLLGDPIEARALGAVLGPGRTADRPLLVGSVKTNIGHLEAASGVAGLIKVALSLRHRRLPPSLHFEAPNPHIPFADLGLAVQRTLGAWPASDRPAAAGLSAFGFGGTNCHVVLEEPSAPRTELLPLSAGSEDALRSSVRGVVEALAASSELEPIGALCRRAAARPPGGAHRLAATARSHGELRRLLEGYLAGEARPGLSVGNAPPDGFTGPVFVFSGQGSHWAGMGRALLQSEPVFRSALERCDEIVQRHLGWSLLTVLSARAGAAQLDAIDVSCPAIVSVEIALAALWRSWGVEPAAVVGHSIGEAAAAHVAGALSLEDALLVSCTQGRLIARIRGLGAMGLVALPWEEAGRALAGHERRLCRAIQESPDSTVLAGDPAALAALFAALEQREVFCRRVNVDVAAHSPQVDVLREELLRSLREVRPGRASVPMVSSVTGSRLDGERLDAAHWVRNLAEPVLFAEVAALLLQEGHATFLEVSPHPLVKRALRSCAAHAGRQVTVLGSLRRGEDERAVLLDTLGTLYAAGQPVRWQALAPAEREAAGAPALDAETADAEAADAEAAHLVPLSARRPEALVALAEAYRDLLRQPPPGEAPSLQDLAYTAGARRGHHDSRLALVARSSKELLDLLDAFLRGEPREGLAHGQRPPGARPKVAFVFPGQGSQWVGMGRALAAAEPVFRGALQRCDDAIRNELGWSLLEELDADEDHAQLHRIDVVQPALFAIEVALSALWRSWGVQPDAVVGHSMGEVAAAHVAGALTLEDAARVICRRSRLLRRLSAQGAMALVELPLPEATRALHGHEARVSVAASNSPRSTVLSGDRGALEEILSRLERSRVFWRWVKVDVASHSQQVDPLLGELRGALSEVAPAVAPVPMYSTVTGALCRGDELAAEYWVRNLREPVLFSQAIARLAEDGHTLFLEMSPHPILTPSVEEGLRERAHGGVALGSLRRGQDERRALLLSAATVYAHGHPVSFKRVAPPGGRCVRLPSYPWQRERYWLDDSTPPGSQPDRPAATRAAGAGHPLLGRRLSSSVQPGMHFWEQEIRADLLPYLLEHRVQQEVVMPGAAFVEMALSAAGELVGVAEVDLEDVTFERMLAVPPDGGRQVQLALTEDGPGQAAFVVSSLDGGAWTRHVAGRVRRRAERPDAAPGRETPGAIQGRCPRARSGAEHYQRLDAAGLSFGESFRGVEQLWTGQGEVLGRVRLPDMPAGQAHAYQVHPALLDACFQVISGLIDASSAPGGEAALVLTALGRARVLRRPGRGLWSHARLEPARGGDAGELAADLRLIDDDGETVLEAEGVRIRRIFPHAPAGRRGVAGWLYGVAWRREDPAQGAPLALPPGAWVLLVDRRGTGAALSSWLRERGQRCVQIVAGDGYTRVEPDLYRVDPTEPGALLAALRDAFAGQRAPRGVVHLWGLDAAAAQDTTAETLAADQELGAVSALCLSQAVSRMGWRDAPKLWLVTRGAQEVGAGAAALSMAQAPLWGLGRTLALEQPELGCARIDLSPEGGAQEALALAQELCSPEGEADIALRPEGRYVARLAREELPPAGSAAAPGPPALAADPALAAEGSRAPSGPEEGARFAAEGTYLVTGGLGGVPLSVVAWMAARGARHLVLVAPDDAPAPAAAGALEALAKAGADVLVIQADVSRPADVARVLSEIDRRAPPLRGIVHAAEVLDDGAALELDAERFRRVVAPGLQGAWNLHAMTLDRSLDVFVLYASGASLLGLPGQASRAAASAFLGALARHRRARGLRALSIHWGALSAPDPSLDQPISPAGPSHRGIGGFTPAQAVEVLDRALAAGVPQIGALDLNLRHFLELHPSAAGAPLLSELRREDDRTEPPRGPSRLVAALSGARPDDRAGILEQHLREQLGGTLRQDPSRIQRRAPFRSLGLDSLMAIELRNRLESSTGLRLSAALLFTYSDVASLGEYVLGQLGLAPELGEAAPGGAGGAGDAPQDPWSGLEEEVARMSDDRAEELLLESLLSLEERLVG
ncbi:6-deoxyerythronolide-B synthase [Sorangium cellulosum]|uniref:6-deoxyerythronolide-B synthase n=1 Tax=Sorangium cellulosum TaxID=56 RepID=A0A2L0F8I5_SORCE|nr:type I polyketide synthase [Sorangium cellulosum]AUX47811.1 6-deoxyerythronolide-B synthase [Sorangium cellulosum]